jgi:hypothetical protein
MIILMNTSNSAESPAGRLRGDKKHISYISSKGYIADLVNAAGEIRCYNTSCYPWIWDGDIIGLEFKGQDGQDGDPADDGTTSDDPSANFPINENDLSGWRIDFTTGINELVFDHIGLHVFPNPAEENLTIQLTSSVETSMNIAVIDVKGRRALTISKPVIKGENQLKIDISGLKPGVYFLHVVQNTGNSAVVQFVKN